MTSQVDAAPADSYLAELALSISRSSPVPLHHQLRQELKSQIERGTLRPGQQIPHERQYAESVILAEEGAVPDEGTLIEGEIVRVIGTDRVVVRTRDRKEVIVLVDPRTAVPLAG